MPSALETLVKILKLERQQGYKNTSVIGGLGAFSSKWSADAHTQARKREHHLLVEELVLCLREYEQIENKTERHDVIGYMLDRVVGRIPPSPRFESLEAGEWATVEPAPPPAPPPRPERRSKRPPPVLPAAELAAVSDSPADLPAAQAPESPAVSADDESDIQAQAGTPQNAANAPRREAKKKRKAKQPQENKPAAKSSRQQAARGDDEDDSSAAFQDGDQSITYEDPLFAESGGRRVGRGELDLPPLPRLARPPRRPRAPLDEAQASDILHGLAAPVTSVRGIGSHMAQLLEKLNIRTINDLLFYLPRRYDDYTQLRYISRLQPETTATVIGTVRDAQVRIGRSGRKDFYVLLEDGSASLDITFFGQHFLSRKVRSGHQLVVSGKISIFRNRLQMTNPEWEHLDAENLHTTGIVPIYPLTEGLRPRNLRRIMKDTIDYWANRLPDYVPEATLERCDLADLGWTIRNLHFPEGMDHLDHARTRFVFDELLLLQLAILANRREWQASEAPALTVTDDFLEPFLESVFPYALTGAQRRSIEDIRRDVSTSIPMNRLLQGDVGAGKTAVATAALAMAFASGKQAVLMAPTGILAEQHYRGISRTLAHTPGERQPVIGLLTSTLTATERAAIYNGLADGSIDIVIGTHAVIQEGVQFNDLAVAVIDEQHRFGVEQRKALRSKGHNPHLLVMTATPIPRTLALTIYADLDLSILDEMPPGRKPVQTRLVNPNFRERMYQFIEKQIAAGRQAFVVHPLVEASEKIEAASAVEAYEDLKQVFHRYRVGLLHGRMKPAEKDMVMAAFSNHEFDILVTTSVAEVGVDIPNASVIVIEDADRFGLAQLHQFRGRVGRGEHASYCLLVSSRDTEEAMERLHALEATHDGFRLAEIDWKQRGAGDLIGTRQSGSSTLQLMEAMTPHLVEMAQREARTLYEEDPDLSQPQHRMLRERVTMLHNERSDVS